MTRKQIDQAREVRLWISQIVVPAVTTVTIAMSIPEVREAVKAKANEMKYRIENKIKK